jgi:formiminotetrahydrofolate cyclodeaminase
MAPVADGEDLLDARLRDFLDRLASVEPSPAGGSVAAVTVAMAAGVLAKVARASQEQWASAGGVLAQAEALRARVEPRAQADADAYAEAFAALRQAPAQQERLGRLLSRAADLPLRIAEAAADVASLATLAAHEGDPAVSADAAAAALLAEAAARAASNLVAVNLLSLPDDPRVRRAREFERSATQAAERAVAARE